MPKNKKNIKEILSSTIPFLLMLGCGFIAGFLGTKNLDQNELAEISFLGSLFGFIFFISSVLVQTILHEAGHLVFGLMSGYEFVSFRVGSFTLIKENNKFFIKKFNLKGTAGQCLMMPKSDNCESCSYVLYNLGGILMNALVSILCFIIYSSVTTSIYLSEFLYGMIIFGVIAILTNGIPMKISGISNDGYNTFSILKNNTMKYCFYIQLKVHGLLSKGMRIKDMPIEWFEIDEKSDFSNPLICSIKCIEASYYHDRLEFDKAKSCYEFLINYSPNILKLFENEIKCELLFYEIIVTQNQNNINELYTKKLKSYIKATNCYISRARLMYAYHLIIEKDIKKANTFLDKFDKLKNTYPVKGEISGEVEVINFIKNKFLISDNINNSSL
ncbi:site-2 protease family protein [Romboutsia lituseburensis]|uniref:site-2 protease family protein n=1 Tax=Romboutsia lituseburensis TaxID=1537 RepID=UPI00215A1917|nr:site-2 protease family protein [Romboutsia lituseburensis]MCR8743857.1 hypothetical protein [Romboutsia lituseburensis]